MDKFIQRKMSMPSNERGEIKERVGIFVDVQNVFRSAYRAYPQHRINYYALLERVRSNRVYSGTPREIIKAIAYTVRTEDRNQENFVNLLKRLRFDVKERISKLHDVTDRETGEVTKKLAKANWDIELTVDVMELKDDLDTVVIVSCDGDFIPLIKRLRIYDIRCEVYVFDKFYNLFLRDVADKIFFFRKNDMLKTKGKKEDGAKRESK